MSKAVTCDVCGACGPILSAHWHVMHSGDWNKQSGESWDACSAVCAATRMIKAENRPQKLTTESRFAIERDQLVRIGEKLGFQAWADADGVLVAVKGWLVGLADLNDDDSNRMALNQIAALVGLTRRGDDDEEMADSPDSADGSDVYRGSGGLA